ncbi:MAG TPA: hypothetical protein VG734_25925 [Lacunisphaera sp.]|nr:hypothetical protein [Lacunisphaera sp.]
MEAKTPDAQRQALGVFCVARGICDPNDIEKPHPNFECAEDLIPLALSRVTIDRLLSEIAALVVESGPLETEADDDEVQQLAMMLSIDDPFQHIDPSHVAMARRHIRLALNELLDGYQPTPE